MVAAAVPHRLSWRVRTCSTGSGCAASTGAPTRARSRAPRTRCSTRSACRRSPSGARRELLATGERVRRHAGYAQSVYVHSVTGYWVRFPIHDMDRLLLATQVGGAPLSADHGYPVRLVAPGRRGYWWVKWVDRIELQTTPSWWQPPFPTG